MFKHKVALKFSFMKKKAHISHEVLKAIRHGDIHRAKRLVKAYDCLFAFQRNNNLD